MDMNMLSKMLPVDPQSLERLSKSPDGQMLMALLQPNARLKELQDTADYFNHPAYFCSNSSHPGTLAAEQSFLTVEADSTVLTAVLPTGEPGVIRIRFCEYGGRNDAIRVHLSKAPATVTATDLNGRKVPSDAAVSGSTISLTVGAHSLGELKITF